MITAGFVGAIATANLKAISLTGIDKSFVHPASQFEEPMDQYDPEVAERALAFAVKVDDLALLLTGEPDERVACCWRPCARALGTNWPFW